MTSTATRADNYRILCAKVDAFFSRVQARVGDQMQCAAGCAQCCQRGLTVTRAEAEAVVAWIADLSSEDRATLAANVARRAAADDEACVALDEQLRCSIYDARPIVCRSHGVAVRVRDARSLPVVTACELNFAAGGPAGLDADLILDQTTLSMTLLAISDSDATRFDLLRVILDACASTQALR